MCLIDNRVWTRVVARQRSVIIPVGLSQILTATPYRVGLLFSFDSTSATLVGPGPVVSAVIGFQVDPGAIGNVLSFYWDHWGGALGQVWSAFGSGVPGTLSVTELLIAPEDWDYFLAHLDAKNLPRLT